ncbi:mechanosensitive ion channel domain-containing protein [uncultured Thiodictyon sp.]|uniref:mechanosensitive ion channel domain-containing protein n=1 Tax=uncultured Thiodictyon sp. TaxID=1846217 RepID=UPI0025E543E7|nr:mechanosensitive ion channel domain-containing protein [uncultured Thiodictyon sp.]
MSTKYTPFRVLIALLLCLVDAIGLAQDSTTGLPGPAEIREETTRILEIGAALAVLHGYRTQESERLAAELAAQERTLRTADVHPDMLREAALARDSMRARDAFIEGQMAHRRSVLAGLRQRISALGRGLDDVPADDRDTQSQREILRLLQEQAQALRALIDGFGRLLAADRRNEALSAQRLRLLQDRIGLDAVDRPAAAAQDPRALPLETAISGFLSESGRLAAEAGAIAGNDPAASTRRTQLAMRLNDAGTRAFLADNDLDLIGLGAQLDRLVALREDSAMPVGLLTQALDALQLLADQLRSLQAELADERQALGVRRTLLRGRGLEDGPLWVVTAELEGLIDNQGQRVAALLERLAPEPARFAGQIAALDAAALTERLPLPGLRRDWRRIGAGIAALPTLVIRQQGALALDLEGRFTDFSGADWAILVGGALALSISTLGLSGWLGRPGLTLGRRLAVPVRALVPVLPWGIPALLWVWLGTYLDLPTRQWLPGLLLLGAWPSCAFFLALARAELFAPGLPAETSAARAAFYRRLRWGLVLAAVVGTVYVTTHSLPLSPLVGDLLDRLAMVGLLLLAVPAFGLKRLILGLAQAPAQTPVQDAAQDAAQAGGPDLGPTLTEPVHPIRHGLRFLAWLSRAIAAALAAAGLLGLAGFLNLAWAIAADLGWLALVVTLLHLTRAALDDLYDVAARYCERLGGDAGNLRGELWQRQFLEPAYALAVLLAWLAALWGLVRLWGWSAQTPPLRTALEWSERSLFNAGHLTLTPRDLVIAGLLVGGAFWIGAWFRQVSFQLAYARVRDQGLRNALSIFTQYLVICCGVVLALKVIGLGLTTLLVFAASLGVGIGFGLQNIVNNFISGILLLVERPVRVGDIVTLSGHEGEVTRIGFRSLTIRTFDKQEVFIPNGSLIAGELINWTRSDDVLRTVLNVGIGYQDDPDHAIALVREILAGYPLVLRAPAHQVTLWEFGDSAIRLRVEYYLHCLGPVGPVAVRSEVNRRIWYGFRKAGISIPYPQHDLHIYPAPAGVPVELPPPIAPE